MRSEPVVVRTYPTEIAAEIARAVLDANGIDAVVRTADAAGLLRFAQGVGLVVRSEDAALAREVLDAAEGDPEPEPPSA